MPSRRALAGTVRVRIARGVERGLEIAEALSSSRQARRDAGDELQVAGGCDPVGDGPARATRRAGHGDPQVHAAG